MTRRVLIGSLCLALLLVPAWFVHDRLTSCPHVVNLGRPPVPISYRSGQQTSTTQPPIVNGRLSMTGDTHGTVVVPVGTDIDLRLQTHGPYFEPPTTNSSDVLPTVTEVGDGRGGWTATFRAAAPGQATITANHPRGRCPGPLVYSDYAVVVRVTSA